MKGRGRDGKVVVGVGDVEGLQLGVVQAVDPSQGRQQRYQFPVQLVEVVCGGLVHPFLSCLALVFRQQTYFNTLNYIY